MSITDRYEFQRQRRIVDSEPLLTILVPLLIDFIVSSIVKTTEVPSRVHDTL